MRELHWESWAMILGLGISLLFILLPGPFQMGAFTFVAQPLIRIAALSYALKALKDLRSRDLL